MWNIAGNIWKQVHKLLSSLEVMNQYFCLIYKSKLLQQMMIIIFKIRKRFPSKPVNTTNSSRKAYWSETT